MAFDYDYLRASDGTGDVPLITITANRSSGSTTLVVSTVTKLPPKFLATAGTKLPSGLLDPATITNFKGHVSGSNIEIDGFLPGSTDVGNTSSQVIIVKPNTYGQNQVAQFIRDATGLGTPEAVTFGAVAATSATFSGSGSFAGALTVAGKDVTQLTPSGTLTMFAAASAPSGWLLCNGSAVSRTSYASLFAAIGTTWGVGDGSTTFNVPDMRGRTPFGVDGTAEFAALNTTGGQKSVQSHNHAISDPGHAHYSVDPATGQTVFTSSSTNRTATSGSGQQITWGNSVTNAAATGVTAGYSGAGANNLNPYISVNFIIKT